MWTVMDSPVGDLRIVERDGSITAIEFSPFRDHDGRPRGARDDGNAVLVEAVRQLRAYFDRDLKEFDLPLDPSGSEFQLLCIAPRITTDIASLRRGMSKRSVPSR